MARNRSFRVGDLCGNLCLVHDRAGADGTRHTLVCYSVIPSYLLSVENVADRRHS
jgi:hypothetical protein